ncbi:prepilin peptidase [Bacillus gaemokensis]|uniref:Peptidase A24 n=1 Tax=Bacillus gaemokensis TaxID=574375 RepID=A0A073KMJ1_9BACI|nr:A24 family peptidase [Bacillus gaemokensis]KEK23578.1 peptidase A24 [Bacillus gaemokensis]KYG26373.1 peptidase A24 [Bacillus gaemokensis]
MLFYLYAFLIGMVFGSFYMVVAMRIPIGESIIFPRSYCHHCRHKLKPKELMPIISFLLQKGCCPYCKRKIPCTYMLCELVTGSVFLISACMIGMDKELLVVWTLLSLLIIITITDLLYMIIPNRILLFFTCVFVIERIFIPLFPWWDGLVGSGIIFVLLYLVQIIYPNGLGGGDVKLLALLGFIIGTKAIFITLCFASCLSLCFFGIGISLKRVTARQALPFGPFIALGTIGYLVMVYLE